MAEREQKLRNMPAEEFVRRLKMGAGQNDIHYAFWVGAGCSISAGIPGAASLVAERWLPRLQWVRGVEDEHFDEWVQNAFPGYDPQNPAAHYGAVMEELFIQPEARQREVEALCDGRFPGFGYAVLAALLGREDGLFNVALTTNFDDLIADAMYVFTEARPLVIPDEALAAFIRPTRMRPLVIKVHGDHRLSPRNTQTETETLKRGISESIANLLHDRGVIFVGYGGNDQGIADLLADLPTQALPLGVWWVSRGEPHGVLREWLASRDAVWVEGPGFEELMLLFQSEFEIDHPTPNKFDRLFAGYLDTYGELERRVGRIPDSDPQASSLKDATARADATATDWPALLLQASRVEKQNPEEAERLYKKGIDEYPRVGLLRVGYGGFLMFLGRFEDALTVAQKAVELDSHDWQARRLLGHALAVEGEYEESADAFADAAELAPRSATAHAYYGVSLARLEDLEEAREQLDIALSLQPSTGLEYGSIALLFSELGEELDAETYYRRAIDETPESCVQHANYARTLISLDRAAEAGEQIDTALNLLPVIPIPTLLELRFYEFVIFDDQRGREALNELKQLIDRGIRSPAWPLADVVEFGRDHGHEDAGWLSSLAAVIENREDPEILAAWKRWSEES